VNRRHPLRATSVPLAVVAARREPVLDRFLAPRALRFSVIYTCTRHESSSSLHQKYRRNVSHRKLKVKSPAILKSNVRVVMVVPENKVIFTSEH
jgi:hypothetical protein